MKPVILDIQSPELYISQYVIFSYRKRNKLGYQIN